MVKNLEEQNKKLDLQNKLKKEEEEKKILAIKKADNEKKAKTIQEQKEKLKQVNTIFLYKDLKFQYPQLMICFYIKI